MPLAQRIPYDHDLAFLLLAALGLVALAFATLPAWLASGLMFYAAGGTTVLGVFVLTRLR